MLLLLLISNEYKNNFLNILNGISNVYVRNVVV